MTKSQGNREIAVMISSTTPSTKYSCSGSPLRFWNGNTANDGLSGSGSADGTDADGFLAALAPEPGKRGLAARDSSAPAHRDPRRRGRGGPRRLLERAPRRRYRRA